MSCSSCQRPVEGVDAGCDRCGRPPLAPQVLDRARSMATEFTLRRAGDPWLRSASLLSYSLRSRRRGFLDDPARPFTRAALRFLFELAWLGGPCGVSPLAETVLAQEIRGRSPVLARAVHQLLDLHRDALDQVSTDFDGFLAGL